MKVEEAKTKVCPFIAFSESHYSEMGTTSINCICDDCMAWQYQDTKFVGEGLVDTTHKTNQGYCKRLGQ